MTDGGLEFDRSLLGRSFTTGRFEITEERIAAYRSAIDAPTSTPAPGPPWTVAPPVFVLLQVLRGISDLARELRLPPRFGDLSTQTGQAIDVLEPVFIGDRVEKRTGLRDAYTKTGRTGTMAFVVWGTDFVNQDGMVVARARMSFMTRMG